MNKISIEAIIFSILAGVSTSTLADTCIQAGDIDLEQHQQKFTDPLNIVSFTKSHSKNLIALNTLDSKIQGSLLQQVGYLNCLAGNNKPNKLMLATSAEGISQIRNEDEHFIEEAIAVVNNSQ